MFLDSPETWTIIISVLAVSPLLAVIYIYYKLESKRLALMERGILKPKTSANAQSTLLAGSLLVAVGAALLVAYFVFSDFYLRLNVILGLLPLSSGVALLAFYRAHTRTEEDVEKS